MESWQPIKRVRDKKKKKKKKKKTEKRKRRRQLAPLPPADVDY